MHVDEPKATTHCKTWLCETRSDPSHFFPLMEMIKCVSNQIAEEGKNTGKTSASGESRLVEVMRAVIVCYI